MFNDCHTKQSTANNVGYLAATQYVKNDRKWEKIVINKEMDQK